MSRVHRRNASPLCGAAFHFARRSNQNGGGSARRLTLPPPGQVYFWSAALGVRSLFAGAVLAATPPLASTWARAPTGEAERFANLGPHFDCVAARGHPCRCFSLTRHGRWASSAWSETPIRDNSCCCHPLITVPYLRFGPRRVQSSIEPARRWPRAALHQSAAAAPFESRPPPHTAGVLDGLAARMPAC